MSWASTIYLTIDVDWNHDDVVRYALARFKELDVPVTVFLTHETPLNQEMERDALASEMIGFGAHPNFNPYFDGTRHPNDTKTAQEAFSYCRSLAVDMPCWRSHSLTHSSRLLDLAGLYGFTHESNAYIPFSSGCHIKPWRHDGSSLVRAPLCFDDSLADRTEAQWDARLLIDTPGLRVLNFHPGRLFLNWQEETMPEEVRAVRREPERFATYRRSAEKPGSWSFLREVVERARAMGLKFGLIEDIDPDD